MRDKLICPHCEEKGRKEVLGEIDKDGNLCIRRRRTGNGETKIISPEFMVQCGVCGEVVFYKKEKHEPND